MNRIKELREDNDLLQSKLASILNVADNTYSQYETKIRDVSVSVYRKLSRFYDTSIDYILYRTDIRDAYVFSNFEINKNSNRLKELRKSINKTQREIAENLNMPLKTYIKYENGERSLNTLLLNIFADYYKTSIDYIVYNTDNIVPHKRSIVDWKEK